jgi:hypothetical protein
MENIFFSKQNYNSIFEVLQKKILQTHNVDIRRDERYNKELVGIMKNLYANRADLKLPSNLSTSDASRVLSQKTINVANNYFITGISKSVVGTHILQRDISHKTITPHNPALTNRPTNTSFIPTPDVNKSYNLALQQRDNSNQYPAKPNFQQNNINENNEDVSKKYNELTMGRRNDYSSTPITKAVVSNNPYQHPSTISSKSSAPVSFSNNTNSFFDQSNNQDNGPSILEQQFSTNTMNIAPQQNNKQIPSQVISMSTYPSINQQLTLNNQTSMTQGAMQFQDSAITGRINMESDTDNYDDILVNMNNQFNPINSSSNSNMYNNTDSFDNNFQNTVNDLNPNENKREKIVENLFPTNVYDTKNTASTSIVKSSPEVNSELAIIKSAIDKQQAGILDATNKLATIIDKFSNQDLSSFYQTVLDIPRLMKIQEKQPLTIRTRSLIISSKDRKLTNTSFDKYNFRVVFGAEGDYTDNTFINNNINIGTGSVTAVQTSYISSGLMNPSVQQVLKNVVSIKLNRVIIPQPQSTVFFPEPYYLVSVDEFNSNIVSSKTFNQKIFCKIHYDKTVTFGSRSYLYYKNDDDDFTMFYASPLSKLDRLTLKLLDSDGESLKQSFNDIDYVTIGAGAGDTNINFYNNSFVGDKIYQTSDIANIYTLDTIAAIAPYTITTEIRNSGTPTLPAIGDFVVNLSNQIEYIFEVKTTEPDPTNDVRPSIN